MMAGWVTGQVLLDDLPAKAAGAVAVAPFGSLDELTEELGIRESDSLPRRMKASAGLPGELVSVIVGREFLVPAAEDWCELDLLREAVDVSAGSDFRQARRDFHTTMLQFVHDGAERWPRPASHYPAGWAGLMPVAAAGSCEQSIAPKLTAATASFTILYEGLGVPSAQSSRDSTLAGGNIASAGAFLSRPRRSGRCRRPPRPGLVARARSLMSSYLTPRLRGAIVAVRSVAKGGTNAGGAAEALLRHDHRS
jgi:hypothetical protein